LIEKSKRPARLLPGSFDFYVHHARLEMDAFNKAVTDWEKRAI